MSSMYIILKIPCISLMDNIANSVREYIYPQELTFSERLLEYTKNNPSTVAAGTAVGLVGWYTIPVVLATVTWIPYLGAGYYLYQQSQTATETISWYQWGKSWFSL